MKTLLKTKKMKHELIKIDDYLLIVSDELVNSGDYFLNDVKRLWRWNSEGNPMGELCKKIIAHRPLNEAPYLDGVDVLPEIEDEVDKEAKEFAKNTGGEVKQFGLGAGMRRDSLHERNLNAGDWKSLETLTREVAVKEGNVASQATPPNPQGLQ